MEPPPESRQLAQRDSLLARIERADRAWRLLRLELRTLTPRGAARLLLVILALWLLLRLAVLSWDVLAPFIGGLALAYLLLPLVNRLERFMPRWLAILVVFAALIGALTAVWAYIVPPLVSQISALVGALPDARGIEDILRRLQRAWSALDAEAQRRLGEVSSGVLGTLRENVLTYLQGLLNFIIGGLFTVFNVLGFLLGLVIVPFFVYYVLNDHAEIAPAIDRMLPPWMRADFWAFVRIFDTNFSSYLRGQLVLVLLGAVATFLGLEVLELVGMQGVQYTLLLSIFSGLTVLIPYVGFVLATLAAFGVGAFTSWQTGLAMAVVVFVVKQVVDTLVYPIIVGRSIHMHEAIVLIVLVVLSEFGFIWVVLAPPIAAVARDLFLYVYGRFEDPPRPAGLLPGQPLPQLEAPTVQVATEMLRADALGAPERASAPALEDKR
jgi:predicted PurR-regulated permease PerM